MLFSNKVLDIANKLLQKICKPIAKIANNKIKFLFNLSKVIHFPNEVYIFQFKLHRKYKSYNKQQ